MNYRRLSAALNQAGPWVGQGLSVDRAWYIDEMEQRIGEIDWRRAKDDVAPFISPQEQELLSKWSAEFFLSAMTRLP